MYTPEDIKSLICPVPQQVTALSDQPLVLNTGSKFHLCAPIARARQNARLHLMERCEQTKHKFSIKASTMRNHSVFMQTFADIPDYIENTDAPKLDLLDITAITSPELRNLR